MAELVGIAVGRRTIEDAMDAISKQVQQERVRRLRDAAVRLVSCARPEGNLEIGGKLMRWRVFKRDDLTVEYLMPVQAAEQPLLLIVRFAGAKVMEISFNETGTAQAHYEPGRWERMLMDMSTPAG